MVYGAEAYFGSVKGATANVTMSSCEPDESSLVVECFEYMEGHEGPPYFTEALGGLGEVMSIHTACDPDVECPVVCE